MKWLGWIAASLMFLAMPLGAQDRQITIPRDVNEITIVIDSITLGITIERPPPDTAAIRRQEAATRATESLAAAIAADSGGNTIVTWTNGGLTAAVLLGVYYLRKISQHVHVINVSHENNGNNGNNGRGPPDNRGRKKEKHDD